MKKLIKILITTIISLYASTLFACGYYTVDLLYQGRTVQSWKTTQDQISIQDGTITFRDASNNVYMQLHANFVAYLHLCNSPYDGK